MKKWELTENTTVKCGAKLTQIKAVSEFDAVKIGDLGGWVESEQSLSEGAWIYDGAAVFRAARVIGGNIYGGDIYGGDIYGGNIHGGNIHGGDIYGGDIYGGNIHGGNIHGGTIRGGTIYGGYIYGGNIYGGYITQDNNIGFNNVGSENGYLLAYVDSSKIMISRGCFHGTIDEFFEAVKKTHGDNEFGREYKSLRPIIENRLNKFLD